MPGSLLSSYSAILKTTGGLLNRARIFILIQLLTAFSVLSIFLFILYFFLERNILLYRISLLMVLFITGLIMIFTRVRWQKVGHYFMCCLTCFIWSNVLLLKNGINIVTVQYIMMIVSGGYYILGSRWGLVYSLANTVPVVLIFFLHQFYGIDISQTDQTVNIYAYNFSIIFNFLLLIFVHYYFFRAFKKTSQKEQKLTARLKRLLHSAQKIAMDKTTFLSTMSHELRTPLNAVIGMTNILLEDEPRPEQKDNLEILHFSAENLMSTINDILSFNRLDIGMEKLEQTDFRFDTWLTIVYGSLKPGAVAKDLDFVLEMDERLKGASVRADQSRLTQILFNLAGNAIKFTSEGFVKIKVIVNQEEESLLIITFEVSDSGIGIPDDQMAGIFEPYFRAAHRNNRQYHGTGLGLSIAKRLVELHGANLMLHSKEGVGTLFNFQLKLNKAQTIDPHTDQSFDESGIRIDGLRILIAEDNTMNVMVLQKTLAQWGLKGDVAENGQVAVGAVSSGSYDVVFMDINMPVMDGFEASRLIREIKEVEKSDVYIIALTASIGISIESHPEFQYLDDFLFKPFYPRELRKKLEKVAVLKAV